MPKIKFSPKFRYCTENLNFLQDLENQNMQKHKLKWPGGQPKLIFSWNFDFLIWLEIKMMEIWMILTKNEKYYNGQR